MQVASVGKSERELANEGIEYAAYKRELAEVDRCVLDGQTEGAPLLTHDAQILRLL